MTEQRVSQAGVEVLSKLTPGGIVSQAGVEVLFKINTPMSVSQAGVEILHRVTPVFSVTQAGVEVLYKHIPCGTQFAQIWVITRADGEVFRFTSKDTDLVFFGETYQSCDSLTPSASESVSEADAASSMDLSGMIGPDGITERDLYAGMFDGAKVRAFLVSWGTPGPIKSLLRGTFGKVEQTPSGFRVEIIGDGAKLSQTPLVDLIEPGCRWKRGSFGGFGGPFCGKDITGLIVTGTVDSGTGLRSFVDAARAEAAGYFTQGRVTFTTGNNAGISAEIKSHTSGGNFTLWPKLAFPIATGDQYSMEPGCTYLHESSGGTNGCDAWDNLRRYGGFLKVPGGDKRSSAADVKAPG